LIPDGKTPSDQARQHIEREFAPVPLSPANRAANRLATKLHRFFKKTLSWPQSF